MKELKKFLLDNKYTFTEVAPLGEPMLLVQSHNEVHENNLILHLKWYFVELTSKTHCGRLLIKNK